MPFRKHTAKVSFAFLLLGLTLTGCGGDTPLPTSTNQQAPTSTPSPTPAPTPAQAVNPVAEMFVPNASMPDKIAFAPDGRLFYNELKTGTVRVVKDGVLQLQPFASIQVDGSGEGG